jgi:hypothetical protein
MTTKKANLSPEDVCVIIQKCAECGVAELKFSGLEVKFGREPAPREEMLAHSPAVNLNEVLSQGPESETQTMSPELLQKSEEDLKQEQLAEMVISNPAEFEELLFTGVIENDESAVNTDEH